MPRVTAYLAAIKQTHVSQHAVTDTFLPPSPLLGDIILLLDAAIAAATDRETYVGERDSDVGPTADR